MLWVNIKGVKPWDGRYQFDMMGGEFSTREWGWIKRHSGYLPLTIEEGWDGGDPELFAVFATIALHRAGRIDAKEVPAVFDRIGDSPFGSTITLENDAPEEVEAEGGPPARSSAESTSSSGDDSTTSSGPSTPTPGDYGTADSDGAESTPIRLAT